MKPWSFEPLRHLSFLRLDSLFVSYQAKQPQHLMEELMHLDVGAFRFLRDHFLNLIIR